MLNDDLSVETRFQFAWRRSAELGDRAIDLLIQTGEVRRGIGACDGMLPQQIRHSQFRSLGCPVYMGRQGVEMQVVGRCAVWDGRAEIWIDVTAADYTSVKTVNGGFIPPSMSDLTTQIALQLESALQSYLLSTLSSAELDVPYDKERFRDHVVPIVEGLVRCGAGDAVEGVWREVVTLAVREGSRKVGLP